MKALVVLTPLPWVSKHSLRMFPERVRKRSRNMISNLFSSVMLKFKMAAYCLDLCIISFQGTAVLSTLVPAEITEISSNQTSSCTGNIKWTLSFEQNRCSVAGSCRLPAGLSDLPGPLGWRNTSCSFLSFARRAIRFSRCLDRAMNSGQRISSASCRIEQEHVYTHKKHFTAQHKGPRKTILYRFHCCCFTCMNIKNYLAKVLHMTVKTNIPN